MLLRNVNFKFTDIFIRPKKRRACHIWLAEDRDLSNELQQRFNAMMATVWTDVDLKTEFSLQRKLTVLSRKIGHPICYYLEDDCISANTRFTYQTKKYPRQDAVIRATRIYPKKPTKITATTN